jgi:hypothetical protein
MLHYGFAHNGYETEKSLMLILIDPCYYLVRTRLCLVPPIKL